MRETYAPVILQRKVNRLRRQTGNPLLRSALASDKINQKDRVIRNLRRPLVLLFRSPIVFLFSIFIAIVYSYQFLLFVTIPNVFKNIYHFSVGNIGLAYLGIAVGLLIGNAVFGQISDRILKGKSKGKEMKPEYRLPLMIPAAFCIPACMFIYGWTTYYHVHWIVPICATSLLGLGLNMSLVSCLWQWFKFKELTRQDDDPSVPGRRIHAVLSLSSCCSNYSTVSFWGFFASGWRTFI